MSAFQRTRHAAKAAAPDPAPIVTLTTLLAFALIGLMSILTPLPAVAQLDWRDYGLQICGGAWEKRSLGTAPDPGAGIYYVWEDLRGGNPRVYAQRADSTGTLLWGPNGLAVFTTTVDQLEPRIAVDATGNLFVLARQLRTPPELCVCAQCLSPAGSRLWESSGRQCNLASGDESQHQVTIAGVGEVVATWLDRRFGPTTARVFAQRLGSGGRLWTDNGRQVSSEPGLQSNPRVEAVGADFIVLWNQESDLRAQRLLASTGNPLWGAAGIPVSPVPGPKSLPRLLTGAAENSYVLWKEEGTGLLRAQSLNAGGAPGWGEGLILGGDPTVAGLEVAPDAGGGVYAVWQASGGVDQDLFVQRVRPDGTLGFGGGGGGGALAVGPGDQAFPSISWDAHEGLFVAWQDTPAGSTTTYATAQWVDSTGVLVYPEGGVLIVNGSILANSASLSTGLLVPCFGTGMISADGHSIIGQRFCDWVTNYYVVFDHTPTANDETLLAGVINASQVGYRCSNVEVICARRVPLSLADNIEALNGVDSVAVAYRATHWLDVSTRAIKARASNTYSPNTAEELGYDGDGIVVAVIDTGVDDGHPSLAGHYVTGFDATTDSEVNPDDDNASGSDSTYHGTHCAGTVMGSDNTYRGVAPGAKLVDVKVLSGSGSGTGEDVMQGIDWCIEHKDDYDIRVVSMSLGSWVPSDGSDPQSKLVNAAVDAGLVMVVAAGNQGPLSSRFGTPAAADKAIVIAAMDDQNTINRADDLIANYSSRGPRLSDNDGDLSDERKPDVTAPGSNIMAPIGSAGVPSNRYHNLSGTSMATPHVAGVVALMLEANPNLTPATVKQILQTSAEDWSSTGCPVDCPGQHPTWDRCYGYGYVDAYKAVQAALNQGNGSICYWIDVDTPFAHGWMGWHFVHNLESGTYSVWVNNHGTGPTGELTVRFYRSEPSVTARFPSPYATDLGDFLLPNIDPGDSVLVGPIPWVPPELNGFGQPHFAIGATVESETDPIRTGSPMDDNNVATRAHWIVTPDAAGPQTVSFWVRNELCESCAMVLELDREALPLGWTASLQGMAEGAPVTFAAGEERMVEAVILPGDPGVGTLHVEASQWTQQGTHFIRSTGGLALTVDTEISSVDGDPALPAAPTLVTTLRPIVPLPARSPVTLRFDLARPQVVRLEVFDAAGRLVGTPCDESRPAGRHEISWDRDLRLASGLYWVRMRSEEGTQTRRLLVMR